MKILILSSKLFNYFNILMTVIGYFYFKLLGKTPSIFYQSYIRSYCFTNAKIRDFLSKIENLFTLNKKEKSAMSENTDSETELALFNLNNEGYHVFEQRLDQETISKLLNFAHETECEVYDDNGKKFYQKYNSHEKKISSKYSFKEQDLFNNLTVQKLINNKIFIQIAEKYFKKTPILSAVNMWWNPVRKKKLNIQTEKNNQSAQMYHFDLDRIKWLKLFIYLTDTDKETGPHEYVATSHRPDNKPKELLDLGYKRIPDDLINKHYQKNLIKKVCGRKGTIFIADTSCYHRGLPPEKNDRLIMVIEYASSLFGAQYKKVKLSKIPEIFKSSKILFQKKIV